MCVLTLTSGLPCFRCTCLPCTYCIHLWCFFCHNDVCTFSPITTIGSVPFGSYHQNEEFASNIQYQNTVHTLVLNAAAFAALPSRDLDGMSTCQLVHLCSCMLFIHPILCTAGVFVQVRVACACACLGRFAWCMCCANCGLVARCMCWILVLSTMVALTHPRKVLAAVQWKP